MRAEKCYAPAQRLVPGLAAIVAVLISSRVTFEESIVLDYLDLVWLRYEEPSE